MLTNELPKPSVAAARKADSTNADYNKAFDKLDELQTLLQSSDVNSGVLPIHDNEALASTKNEARPDPRALLPEIDKAKIEINNTTNADEIKILSDRYVLFCVQIIEKIMASNMIVENEPEGKKAEVEVPVTKAKVIDPVKREDFEKQRTLYQKNLTGQSEKYVTYAFVAFEMLHGPEVRKTELINSTSNSGAQNLFFRYLQTLMLGKPKSDIKNIENEIAARVKAKLAGVEFNPSSLSRPEPEVKQPEKEKSSWLSKLGAFASPAPKPPKSKSDPEEGTELQKVIKGQSPRDP